MCDEANQEPNVAALTDEAHRTLLGITHQLTAAAHALEQAGHAEHAARLRDQHDSVEEQRMQVKELQES